MPKVTYTSAKGLVQSAGSGITFETTPVSTVQRVTADSSVTGPGVYTISGSTGTGIVKVALPLASAVPGGIFVFRATSADAHIITGSAEPQGTRVLKGFFSGSNGAQQPQGSSLTLAPFIGNSVSLISDGKNFCLLAASGSLTFGGT